MTFVPYRVFYSGQFFMYFKRPLLQWKEDAEKQHAMMYRFHICVKNEWSVSLHWRGNFTLIFPTVQVFDPVLLNSIINHIIIKPSLRQVHHNFGESYLGRLIFTHLRFWVWDVNIVIVLRLCKKKKINCSFILFHLRLLYGPLKQIAGCYWGMLLQSAFTWLSCSLFIGAVFCDTALFHTLIQARI